MEDDDVAVNAVLHVVDDADACDAAADGDAYGDDRADDYEDGGDEC